MIFKNNSKYNYPLLNNTLAKEDIRAAKKDLDSKIITMSKETINYIFDSIEYVINNANKHKGDYIYDEKQNLFIAKKN